MADTAATLLPQPVKLTSLIQDALEITLTPPLPLRSLLREAHELAHEDQRRFHHFLKVSLGVEGTGTGVVAAHPYWRNLANVTLESVYMSTSQVQTNGTSNSTAYVSVFSVNKDLTWLTTSASFMSVERMMPPPPPPLITTAIQEATVTAVSVMEGTRGNVDQTTSAQRCYTTLLHNAALVASLMLNFKPTSCLSEFN